ncbi:thioredoxin peroxidase dot5 [Malassezia nana]|uniref:thioredoxin-dependent peroxiredoxin n=1 Tax=Malassezia nana TaxID=180528 RepID=A0AAF0EL95_9BASI|nr:thioredoxin peroxidase dot5 [Malassezia nana]
MANEPSPAPAPERRTSARVARKRSTETIEDVKAPKQARTEPADSKEPRGPAAPLKVGDTLPALELLDQAEERVRIADLKKVVLFTYPRANTPGCTRQAQCFRDAYDDWKKAGYEVYGLSSDSPKAQTTWSKKLSLPYRLLCDPKRELIGALTGTKASTKRSHFVIGEDGTLTLSAIGVKPGESSSSALASVTP